MVNDGDVFGLAEELLVYILTRAEHRLVGRRPHLAHLLRHLASSWG